MQFIPTHPQRTAFPWLHFMFVSVWTFRKLRPTWVWSGALMLRWHDVLAGIWGTQSEVCEPLY